MAFLDNLNQHQVASDLAALRALPTVSLTAWDCAFVPAKGMHACMRFDPACTATDSPEDGIILPDDRTAQEPGRWVFEMWHR